LLRQVDKNWFLGERHGITGIFPVSYVEVSLCLCWYTHPFNSPFSGTTLVSRYQKGKTNLDFTEARDSEWQWHQLGHMQVCPFLQTETMPATHHSAYAGSLLFIC